MFVSRRFVVFLRDLGLGGECTDTFWWKSRREQRSNVTSWK